MWQLILESHQQKTIPPKHQHHPLDLEKNTPKFTNKWGWLENQNQPSDLLSIGTRVAIGSSRACNAFLLHLERFKHYFSIGIPHTGSLPSFTRSHSQRVPYKTQPCRNGIQFPFKLDLYQVWQFCANFTTCTGQAHIPNKDGTSTICIVPTIEVI